MTAIKRLTRAMVVLTVFAVAAIATAPAGGQAATPKANCIGELASWFGSSFGSGFGLGFVSTNAREWGGIGRVVGPEASSDTCGG